MMTALVIFGCFAAVMTFSYIEKVIQLDRCQADSTKQQKELNNKYRTFYRNVERAHGYCAAQQASHQPGEYEAQMFSIESTTTAPKGTKSIEVL